MGNSRAKYWVAPGHAVREDWFSWLPAEKDGVFDAAKAELEPFYAMLSVMLNEAFSLRDQGALAHAREQAGISAELCDRFAARLLGALRAIEEHGRHYGTLPHVVPLNPEFFRGDTAQHIARKSGLLSKVLFSSRSKVFHKLHAVGEAIEELRTEFRETAEELLEGAAVHPASCWGSLEVLHYDLNTCLRETLVMLRSFVRALPDEEAQAFRQKLRALARAAPAVRHRRRSLFRRK